MGFIEREYVKMRRNPMLLLSTYFLSLFLLFPLFHSPFLSPTLPLSFLSLSLSPQGDAVLLQVVGVKG
jgi:hypothetical protein